MKQFLQGVLAALALCSVAALGVHFLPLLWKTNRGLNDKQFELVHDSMAGLGMGIGNMIACYGSAGELPNKVDEIVSKIDMTQEQRKSVYDIYIQGFGVSIGFALKEKPAADICQKTETMLKLAFGNLSLLNIQ